MRKERSPSEEAHWSAVNWTERVAGLVLVLAGVSVNQFGTANGMGWALVGVGVYALLPNARPLISGLVERIPGLPKKEP